ELPNAASSAPLGSSSDLRRRGVLLEALSLVPIGPIEPPPDGASITNSGSLDVSIEGVSTGPLEGSGIIWLEGSGPAPQSIVIEPKGRCFSPEKSQGGWSVGLPVSGAALAGEPLTLTVFGDPAAPNH